MSNTTWPKEGDTVYRESSGAQGEVLCVQDGKAKIDWGLFVSWQPISELVPEHCDSGEGDSL